MPREELAETAPEVLRRFEANGAEDGDWGAVDATPARTSSDPRMEVRRNIFVGVRAAGMIRSTEDKVYSILADALPIGNGRCQKRGERHAVCDACLARRATTVRETCRHAHLECPSVEVVLAIAYLAAIQVASSNVI